MMQTARFSRCPTLNVIQILCIYLKHYVSHALGFNDISTLAGHFVSSPREREKRDRRDSRRDEREGQEERGTGVKVKKQKE